MRVNLMEESNRVSHMFDKLCVKVVEYNDDWLLVALQGEIKSMVMNIEMFEMFESNNKVCEYPDMYGTRY